MISNFQCRFVLSHNTFSLRTVMFLKVSKSYRVLQAVAWPVQLGAHGSCVYVAKRFRMESLAQRRMVMLNAVTPEKAVTTGGRRTFLSVFKLAKNGGLLSHGGTAGTPSRTGPWLSIENPWVLLWDPPFLTTLIWWQQCHSWRQHQVVVRSTAGFSALEQASLVHIETVMVIRLNGVYSYIYIHMYTCVFVYMCKFYHNIIYIMHCIHKYTCVYLYIYIQLCTHIFYIVVSSTLPLRPLFHRHL